MALNDIIGTDGTENMGAIRSAAFVPTTDIASILRSINGVLNSAITLSVGKRWYGIDYRSESATYTEEGNDVNGGSLFKYQIAFFIAKITDAKTELFRKMLSYRYALDTIDNNGTRKLVGCPDGSLETGLHFKYIQGVKDPVSGQNGYAITFFGEFCKPAVGYEIAGGGGGGG